MEKTKEPVSPETKQRRKVATLIGRTAWQVRFKQANPEATKEQMQAAWGDARSIESKVGMRTLKQLEKSGYQIVASTPKG